MTKKKQTTTRKKPLTQKKKKKKSSVAVKTSTRKTSKVKSAKTPTPVKKVKKAKKAKKQSKPKNDINAEIDRILAGMYEPKTTKRKKPISKPKRTRKLSMSELNRKIGKMVRDALKQPTRKGRR